MSGFQARPKTHALVFPALLCVFQPVNQHASVFP